MNALPPSRILLTGAAGFIGSHTAERLLSAGHSVVGLDNFSDYYDVSLKRANILAIEETAARAPGGATFELIMGDIRDEQLLSRVFSENAFDAVIHLAACAGVRPSIADPALYVDVNVRGTLNVLEAMRRADVRRLLFASSSSVYGNNEKVPFSESDFVDHPISPYAATKKAGELLCHTYHALHGLSVACLRFFTVYGPRQRPDLAIRKFAEMMLAGAPIPFYGDGGTRRDYTYIDDIQDGIGKALAYVFSGERFDVFNLGESGTVTLSHMVEALADALGVTPVLDRLPAQPGDVAITYADTAHARAVLGYAPETPFDLGIQKFAAWYKAQR